MEQNAKQILKRISEKVSTLTDKKISQIAHAPNHNEWRAYIWQTKPHWEDIAWRVKEPNMKGEAEVHLGFYSAKPSEELSKAISEAEELAKGNVAHLLKNENGIRLVWIVNLMDENASEILFSNINVFLDNFIPIALNTLIKNNIPELDQSESEGLVLEINSIDTALTNDDNMKISNLTNDQINWINTNESWDFDKADPVWKNTKSFAIQFMKSKERSVFSKLSNSLKNDGDVARTAILFDASDVLRNIPESLKDDRELILLALQKDGESISYLPDNLKFNRDLVLHAVRQTYKSIRELRFASEELLKDSSFINELCIILKDYTVKSDWKDVLFYIPFEVLHQTNEEFRSFFENLTRAGISNYRKEVAELIFDPNNPFDYKLSLEKIYSNNLPSNCQGWSSSFNIDGAFNYDSEGKIADWGSETLLYDTLFNDFIQNTWKPAMENANLEQLIKMIPSTHRVGKGDFMKDNDVAIYGYNKVIEYINQGDDIRVDQLFELLNANEEFFVLEDELPDVHETLINKLKDKEKDDVFLSLRDYSGYDFVKKLFEEDEKNAFVEWIDIKLSTETDESIVSSLESLKEEMNAWEY
jgi:hypothetical protein